MIDSPDHVLVCGERVERSHADHDCAMYGDPCGVVRVAYWPAHRGAEWSVFLFVPRPSGVRIQYHARSASLSESLGRALYECSFDDCDVVLRSLRAMGRVAHA